MASLNRNRWMAARLPPLIVISGSDGFLRSRELSKATRAARDRGWRIHRLDGSDRASLVGVLSSAGLMGDALVIVGNPDKADPQVLLDHHRGGFSPVVVLLDCEGPPKGAVSDILKELPKTLHASFEAPKPWTAEKAAASLLSEVAGEHGVALGDRVAEALAAVHGVDLGRVYFEMLKAIHLARSRGESEVTLAHLRETISPISKASVAPLVRALGAKDQKALLRSLARLRDTHRSPPVPLVCTWMGKEAARWLQAAALRSKGGLGPEEVAKALGVHPYVYKKDILPVLSRWKERDLVDLVRRLADVSRSVREGRVDPWHFLEFKLVDLLVPGEDKPRLVPLSTLRFRGLA